MSARNKLILYACGLYACNPNKEEKIQLASLVKYDLYTSHAHKSISVPELYISFPEKAAGFLPAHTKARVGAKRIPDRLELQKACSCPGPGRSPGPVRSLTNVFRKMCTIVLYRIADENCSHNRTASRPFAVTQANRNPFPKLSSCIYIVYRPGCSEYRRGKDRYDIFHGYVALQSNRIRTSNHP